jgi:hypothetical protein
VGLSSSIGAALDNDKSTTVWTGIKDGLTRGITNIGLQYAAQEIDVDPLYAALASRAIAGAIEGVLEKQGIFQGIADAAINSTVGLLTLGGDIKKDDPDYYWKKTAYAAKILDFSRITREDGLDKAIETYATAIFHQDTIDSIWKQGGIAELITGKAKPITLFGKNLTEVEIEEGKKIFIDPNTDELVGKQRYGVTQYEKYSYDIEGNPTLDERIVQKIYEDGTKVINYFDKDGNLLKAHIIKHDKTYELLPTEQSLTFNTDGSFTNATVEDLQTEMKFIINKDNSVSIVSGSIIEQINSLEEKRPNEVTQLIEQTGDQIDNSTLQDIWSVISEEVKDEIKNNIGEENAENVKIMVRTAGYEAINEVKQNLTDRFKATTNLSDQEIEQRVDQNIATALERGFSYESHWQRFNKHYAEYNQPHLDFLMDSLNEAYFDYEEGMIENFIYWQVASQNPELAAYATTKLFSATIEESLVYTGKCLLHDINYLGWSVIDIFRAGTQAIIEKLRE